MGEVERSFVDVTSGFRTTDEVFYPEGLDKRPRAPQCQETGVPLPIAPYKKLDELEYFEKNLHHANYPRLHPLLRGAAGIAVRVARLQITPTFLHNGHEDTAFHKIIGDGIKLPETEEEQMGAVVLECANFLPEEVIDTTHGDLRVREMQLWERRLLSRPDNVVSVANREAKSYRDKWLPGVKLIDAKKDLQRRRKQQAQMSYRDLYYGYADIKKFIKRNVLEQDICQVNPQLVERFKRDGRIEDGERVLDALVRNTVESATVKGTSLAVTYKQLYRRGLLGRGMPSEAALLVRYKLGNELAQRDLIAELRENIDLTQVARDGIL